MSSLLSAELAATCNALGYYDAKSDKYYADSNTLETVKDLIRYLRKDDESHDIRRQLGQTKVLQTDLLPLLKNYWEETALFDVLLRLMVNLTTPPLMLWNEDLPTDRIVRNRYLQVEEHLASYKEAFADETFWAVLSTRLSKILETDYAERGDENSLIIERILLLIRNILYVAPDHAAEKRPDNDASVHDKVLWALHQSGMLDIILYVTSSTNERAYYIHALEILSFMLREQNASQLANAALQRSETEKIRDEAELLAMRHRDKSQRQQKARMFTGTRHSRFGGTYVLKSMKSISDNDLIYHKPLNKIDSLDFDQDKTRPKTRKNRLPVQTETYERRSAFSIRLFLKEFCIEFLNGAYNTVMHYVKDNLVRARAQTHDETYYLWAMRFFMEFNRCYKFQMKLVSETMSVQTFRYVQQLMEKHFDMIESDKKRRLLWARRLHLAVLAYRELLLTITSMDASPDGTLRDAAKVIKSNIFYILEYREMIITLLLTYDELKMSNRYLNDLMETQHVFIKMLENFCGGGVGSLVVQKRNQGGRRRRRNKNNKSNVAEAPVDDRNNLENRWDELAPQLSSVMEGGNIESSDDVVVPFNATSDVPIDDQKSDAMKNVQRLLRAGEFEKAISLLRASREVWPENDCFGSSNMAPEEEFLALRDIFFADLGVVDESQPARVQEPISDEDEDDDEGDEEEEEINYGESDFKFQDFVTRLANPKIVRACGLALSDFERNSINTNHCVIKLLHRIAFDCKLYVMVFQVSIFRTFQRIYASKELPQHKELVKFATYIIRQFVKVAEGNEKVFMEALFWKSKEVAYEVEHGYGELQNQKTRIAWTEEQEDELRRLFMEHEEKQIKDDVVDWIVANLIDNTRTRRGVLKKLKEMYLITTDYKSNKRPPRAVEQQWSVEEEEQLRELYERFKYGPDRKLVNLIFEGMDSDRPKKAIRKKLVEMGLLGNKVQRGRQPTVTNGSRDRSDADDSDSDGDDTRPGSSGGQVARPPRKTAGKSKSKGKVTRRSIAHSDLVKLLLGLVNSGMTEALEWLKESLSDALEDMDVDDGDNIGIPLVPIMDYAIEAMENSEFHSVLRGLGICEPADEQETYWRIPSDLSGELLQRYIDTLSQAIDNTLTETVEDNSTLVDEGNSDTTSLNRASTSRLDSDSDNGSARKLKNNKRKIVSGGSSSDEDDVVVNSPRVSEDTRKLISDNDKENTPSNTNKARYILSSDEEDDVSEKRNRSDSTSDAEKPVTKRSRCIISEDEDN